ncbi:hypothetical protein [Vibrio ouci]|uniref:Uncharacterized protein n=1 Tax=Vibrio ouci TaxID=2499078 RepID=A0A4Y8W8N3_9VIBR|nr:hypothetical protein [Vibrio ouci]TFH88915.1 hypothetical protein ELS82_25245 [Vibrio ouci]
MKSSLFVLLALASVGTNATTLTTCNNFGSSIHCQSNNYQNGMNQGLNQIQGVLNDIESRKRQKEQQAHELEMQRKQIEHERWLANQKQKELERQARQKNSKELESQKTHRINVQQVESVQTSSVIQQDKVIHWSNSSPSGRILSLLKFNQFGR